MRLVQTTKIVTNIRYDFVKLQFFYSLAVTSCLNNQLRLRAQSGSCAARGLNPENSEESLFGWYFLLLLLDSWFCYFVLLITWTRWKVFNWIESFELNKNKFLESLLTIQTSQVVKMLEIPKSFVHPQFQKNEKSCYAIYHNYQYDALNFYILLEKVSQTSINLIFRILTGFYLGNYFVEHRKTSRVDPEKIQDGLWGTFWGFFRTVQIQAFKRVATSFSTVSLSIWVAV